VVFEKKNILKNGVWRGITNYEKSYSRIKFCKKQMQTQYLGKLWRFTRKKKSN